MGIYLQCRRLGGTAYNQHWLYTLNAAVDPGRLAAAIDTVIASCPSLDIRLREQDGEPVQYFPEEKDPYRQSVEKITEWREMFAALEEVSPEAVRAIKLKIAGFTLREIADKMGKSVAAVNRLIEKARAFFEGYLAQK